MSEKEAKEFMELPCTLCGGRHQVTLSADGIGKTPCRLCIE